MNTYEYRGIRSLSISCARFVWAYITDKVGQKDAFTKNVANGLRMGTGMPWRIFQSLRVSPKICPGLKLLIQKMIQLTGWKNLQGYVWRLCIILEYRYENEDGTVHPFQVMLPSWKLHWKRKNQLLRLLMLCQLAIRQFGETNVPTQKIGGP